MIDYAVLRVIWWVLMGFLLAGFAVMDGFDLGVAALLPIVAKKDEERRVLLNSVGPVWEGNQVWFILGGGALFAAWPYLYAVSFSGFYLAMFLVLATFIMRPVSFKYRSKLECPIWRGAWDWTLAISGILASLTFGVAVGNVLQGVPFNFDLTLRAFYTGSFFALFNPFALVCGLVSLFMIMAHGALYLSVKTENPIRDRAIKSARILGFFALILFLSAGVWAAHFLKGYVLTSPVNMTGPSNPLNKSVTQVVGAWMTNYYDHPYLLIAPLLGIFGFLIAILFSGARSGKLAFTCSSLGIFGIVTTVGVSMFPFILPSSSNPSQSLLVWDSSSSQVSLQIMLISTVIFMPIILAYTAWVYRVLRGKVTVDDISKNKQDSY